MKSVFVMMLLLPAVVYNFDSLPMEEFVAKVFKTTNVCLQETGAGRDEILQLMRRQLPSGREGKCFLSCFQKKFGIQTENGKFSKEGTLAAIENLKGVSEIVYTKAMDVMVKCFAEVDDSGDACDNSLELTRCAMKVSSENGLQSSLLRTFTG